ncbi:putative Helix-turn-helix domain-containing protein [Candidatus Hydrogenisulfobacillus filiaventi]|uniref:Putative Helix-turn-helix domain-containing protein n=1 Tax=Candidatus Hydrogenisulfobacillus filiaventi TaxID=2707344 RepID=A0A6F8ZH17_9FIRM|nr:putative Helix-turn-helix domain-containing protein [Candidatus Hydrogenisulfobacillus filiaventi]
MDNGYQDLPGDRLGPVLRQAREARGWSLDDAVRELKIRRRYLEALEADDWSAMPGEVYGQGFLRSYARWLGLDGDVLVEARRRVAGAPLPPPALPTLGPVPPGGPTATVPGPRSRRAAEAAGRGNGIAVVGAVLLLLLLIVGGLFYLHQRATAGSRRLAAPRPAAAGGTRHVVRRARRTRSAPVRVVPLMAQGNVMTYQVSRTPIVVSLSFSSACWVRATVDGYDANPAGYTYQPGQVLRVSARHSLRLFFGNPPAASMTVDGVRIGALGQPGQPLHVLFETASGT